LKETHLNLAIAAPRYVGEELPAPELNTIADLANAFYNGTCGRVDSLERRAKELGWRPDTSLMRELLDWRIRVEEYFRPRNRRQSEEQRFALILTAKMHLEVLYARAVLEMARRYNGPQLLIERLEEVTTLCAHEENGQWVVDQHINHHLAAYFAGHFMVYSEVK
jgi:hypothetical protein